MYILFNNMFRYLLVIFSVISLKECAKILGIFPTSGYSQFILCEKLMQKIATRGHQVTVISLYKPEKKIENYETIYLEEITTKMESEFKMDYFGSYELNIFQNIRETYELGNYYTKALLSHDKVQKLINSDEKFDLVIVELFFNHALMGFAKRFNASLILFSSIGPTEWNSHLVGNVNLPSINPLSFTHFTNNMTFLQRIYNSAVYLYDMLYREYTAYPKHQELLDKYFPVKIKLKELLYSTNLMLLNSDTSLSDSFHLTQNMVEIGGFHITQNELPKDIKQFLDEAKHGAILFSMGSNLKISDLSKDKIKTILNVFGKLKQRVLWKFEDADSIQKPDNVLVSSWMPQPDILAHPNMVAFITHAGLLSTTEAIFYGVPMVCIPIFGDQKMNTARSVKNGVAIELPFENFNEETFMEALNEIVNNTIYQTNARLRSNIMREKPIRPIENAMFWIEYIIKYNGAPHLKNSALDLSWYQLYLLDVIFFVLVLFFLTLYFVKGLINILINVIITSRNNKTAVKGKSKDKTIENIKKAESLNRNEYKKNKNKFAKKEKRN